ncbi:hypothetical protein ACNKHK_04160 [Shigella flexneri]
MPSVRLLPTRFEEHHAPSLDNSTDWGEIFSLCQAISLLANRQTLLLQLPENGRSAINEQLALTRHTAT